MTFVLWCVEALLLIVVGVSVLKIVNDARIRRGYEQVNVEAGTTIAWRGLREDPAGGVVVAMYLNGTRLLYWVADNRAEAF